MKHSKHLAGWGRRTFLTMAVITAMLWASGAWMHAWPMDGLFEMDPNEAKMRRACGVLHGVLTWLFCVMVGRGVWPHVRVMWHKTDHAQWWVGCLNLLVFAFLMVTGLVLLYGNADLHDMVSAPHDWVGLLLPLTFLPHTWRRIF